MDQERSSLQWRGGCEAAQCVEVAKDGEGHVLMRDSSDPDGSRLTFSSAGWAEFIAGVKDGEFDGA